MTHILLGEKLSHSHFQFFRIKFRDHKHQPSLYSPSHRFHRSSRYSRHILPKAIYILCVHWHKLTHFCINHLISAIAVSTLLNFRLRIIFLDCIRQHFSLASTIVKEFFCYNGKLLHTSLSVIIVLLTSCFQQKMKIT